MNKMRNTKAITLIALVITIIVLLILAGVAISMLTGENSILNRASQASAENQLGSAQDAVSLLVADKVAEYYDKSYVDGNTTILKDGLNKYLAESAGINEAKVISEIENTNITVRVYQSKFKNEGQVVFKLFMEDNTASYKSEGTVTNGKVEWKISKGTKGEYDNEKAVASDVASASVETPTSKRANITPQPTGSTYTEGDEVTFENEQFFVISDDGTTVELLAKYCLNRTGTEQLIESEDWYGSDYAYYGYGKPFSKTAYWEDDASDSGTPIDLQTASMISKAEADGKVEGFPVSSGDEVTEVPNAIVTAINYGTSKGAKGRLMTYSEAYTILNGNNSTMKNIMLGCWNDGTEPSERWLDWWLGNAKFPATTDEGDVFCVSGSEVRYFVGNDEDRPDGLEIKNHSRG